jgi:hypothetical protein
LAYLRDFADSESPYRVRLDDDDRVAYAYLIDGERETPNETGIIGDVWLYNVAPTPVEPEWQGLHRVKDREKALELMPFLNPRQYVRSESAMRLEEATSVVVEWSSEKTERVAEVVVDGLLYARLKPGAKPGWARLALTDGPCAQSLPRGRR